MMTRLQLLSLSNCCFPVIPVVGGEAGTNIGSRFSSSSQSVYLFLLITFRLLSAIVFRRLPLDGETVVILSRRHCGVCPPPPPAAAPWVALREIIVDV